MCCTKLAEISQVALKWKILKYDRYFVITPLLKDRTLYSNKLKSPLPKDTLCQVGLKIGPVVLVKKIFYFVNIFYEEDEM